MASLGADDEEACNGPPLRKSQACQAAGSRQKMESKPACIYVHRSVCAPGAVDASALFPAIFPGCTRSGPRPRADFDPVSLLPELLLHDLPGPLRLG